jgi:hypothetical protein
MELTFACRACDAVGREADPLAVGAVTCPSCGDERPVTPDRVDAQGLRACLYCGTEDLYVQKDFPQRLGVAIVVVGFVISSVFWYYERPLATYAVLLASALLDMVLFYRVPVVTICYRCLAQHRGEGRSARPVRLVRPCRRRALPQERIRVESIRQSRETSPDDGPRPADPPDRRAQARQGPAKARPDARRTPRTDRRRPPDPGGRRPRGPDRGGAAVRPIERAPYALDASLYEIDPLGVVAPRHRDDLTALVGYANDQGIPLHPRGAGTSMAGRPSGRGSSSTSAGTSAGSSPSGGRPSTSSRGWCSTS